ncbi:hypothetical protein K5I29_12305 [Flavobacterium agricola]|uniref:Uncharacterized protein n=1 Tax=Flavobacterium agricola TaxID=2870839 RepID=A0ABY6LY03_9FLAO|nr:hypothetical protein [Flavobacterium agricola]UYW01218.1 hypothetical protein K5I29_12305 [Flavobacterium agricola]
MMPQVNNAVHYFVVAHHFNTKATNKVEVHAQQENHICEQHIYVQTALLLPSVFVLDLFVPQNTHPRNYHFINTFISQQLFYAFTRGPPATQVIS